MAQALTKRIIVNQFGPRFFRVISLLLGEPGGYAGSFSQPGVFTLKLMQASFELTVSGFNGHEKNKLHSGKAGQSEREDES